MSKTSSALPFFLVLLVSCSGEGVSPTPDSGTGETRDSAADGPEVIDCSEVDAQVNILSLADLDGLLSQEAAGETSFLLVNVHVPHGPDIAGTDEHISYLQTENLKTAIGEPGTKAVLYCRTGPMSDIAAADLLAAGFCNIHDLPAGYVQWEDAGYEMAR